MNQKKSSPLSLQVYPLWKLLLLLALTTRLMESRKVENLPKDTPLDDQENKLELETTTTSVPLEETREEKREKERIEMALRIIREIEAKRTLLERHPESLMRLNEINPEKPYNPEGIRTKRSVDELKEGIDSEILSEGAIHTINHHHWVVHNSLGMKGGGDFF
ncbi:hypothetical protein NPIL_224741 [Nephila pilipes]|uniref:Uncharacterized protein n=1 Tax=Nephila pilipes TaxID=299642 RepID=A0A8X6QRL2_NEPPI|nr:hypothetical protein NPIL_224741 [Nephila pilipes]